MNLSKVFGGLAGLLAATCAATDESWILASDPTGNSDRMFLSQKSPDSIADEYGAKEVHPVLSLYCADEGLGLQIDWQRFISSFKTEAGFKVDGGESTWFKLDVDSSNQITRADVGTTTAVLDTLSSGSALSVEIAPYSEPSVFVSFDLASLEEALARLRDAC